MEQYIATITANKKIMPSMQKAIASRDCDTHRTSGPMNLSDFSAWKKYRKT